MKKLSLGLGILFLIACEHRINAYPLPMPPVIQDYLTDEVYLTRVRVKSVDEIARYCPQGNYLKYGCNHSRFEKLAEGRTYSICTIYVIAPNDFNDVPKLAIQGHELEECFGRRHN